MVESMLAMDPAGVLNEAGQNRNACCSGAAAAAIAASKELGAERGVKLIYATSYDIRPDTSFVGYTGIVFE
jgi:AmmeMemoRadiSam system protein B